MKRIKYSTLIIIMLLLGACGKDFVEIAPQDTSSQSLFYKSEAQVRASTASLYGFPWFGFNSSFFWLAGDCMSGNLYYTYDQEGQYFYFSFSDGNTYLDGGWRSLYRVVSYANSVINDMPSIASKNGVSEDVINAALGEGHFIRAAAYYMLAEFWGDVPIVENSTDLVTSNNMMLPRNTRSSIYQFMIKDLEFAAKNLPTVDAQKGRVTKWSAEGMLAKVYVTMAQNLSDANSATYFAKAKEYAADVIENSGLVLESDYYNLFSIDNNNNSESLFALQWMQGAYNIGNNRQANWARNSIISGNSEAWGAGKSVTYDYLQNIEAGDARRKAIYMQSGDHYDELNKSSEKDGEAGYTYNIYRKLETVEEGAAPLLNSIKKYVVGSSDDTNGKVTTGQATAINQYILRLADLYLIYAEAALGASAQTSDATAIKYFNTIRKRANLADKSPITFADILKERRYEFGLESLYWFDLKRFYYRDPKAALANLNAQLREEYYYEDSESTEDKNSAAKYKLQVPTTRISITASKMFLPIPATEKTRDANLSDSIPAVDYYAK